MLMNPRSWGIFKRANFPGGHVEYEDWKKKRWPQTVPDASQASVQTTTAPFGGGILDKFKDKKRWKHMAEALDKMKNSPIKPLAAGRNVGDSGIQYTPTDMGAYVGDPVARQRAMAEARRKKEKEGLMNLLGGGY